MLVNKRINAYQKDNIKTQIASADPYTLIKMLMAGCLERMAKAKGCIERKDYEGKAQYLSKASAIVISLNQSLDTDIGGEVAQNMSALYVYINDLIVEAGLKMKAEPLDEAMALLLEIKSGWDTIPTSEVQEALSSRQQG